MKTSTDILLTHSNHLFFDPKQVRKMQPYPPLQTLIAAAVLRAEGYSVALFDSTFAEPEAGFREALKRYRPGLVVVAEDNFNFLTKMCLVRNREVAFGFAAAARQMGVRIIVNGSDAADRAGDYLAAGFDAVIAGELEQTLLEFCAVRAQGLAGLVWMGPDGRVQHGPIRKPNFDLGALPEPAWDLVDMGAYRDAWRSAHGYFSLNLVSSRGCPFRCNWCAKPIYGGTYRFHSPAAVARDMLHLKREYQPDMIWFADDIFALSRQWTAEFAAEVERLDARVPFRMQSRCDLMTRDTVADLRRAGCAEVWMGAESGSQRVLDAMEKDLSVRAVRAACENARAHDIRPCLFLQFGYPGETWDDIQQTIDMVRAVRPADVGISVSYPLPNTRLYEKVRADRAAKTNWRDSDDLDLMFRGAYTTEFYRALADALHAEVRSGAAHAAPLWRTVRQMEAVSRTEPPPAPFHFPVLQQVAG
ncbi:MAG TPA: radical SAM protein [Bryobacteraceae bacterium]|nr:radical SAM protein [Bryobacteraceae bacterium]